MFQKENQWFDFKQLYNENPEKSPREPPMVPTNAGVS